MDDLSRALGEGILPLWTPSFLGGSPCGFVLWSQWVTAFLWLPLTLVLPTEVGGRLVVLAAMAANGPAMYAAARGLLGEGRAAAAAALLYLLHPQALLRGGGVEHVAVAVVMPLVPLASLAGWRALERGTWRAAARAALAGAAIVYTHPKQALAVSVLLGLHLLVAASGRGLPWARGLARTLALAGALATPAVTFAVHEGPHLRLFRGTPLDDWQRVLAVRSPLDLVDRDGAVARTVRSALESAPAPTGRAAVGARRAAELQIEAGERYAGLLVLLLAVSAPVLARGPAAPCARALGGCLLLAVSLAAGPRGLLVATVETGHALLGPPSAPVAARVAFVLAAGLLFALPVLLVASLPADRRVRGALLAVAVVALPGFRVLSLLPGFADTRAPSVFSDVPVAFFGSLAGAVALGALGGGARLVAAAAALAVLDGTPYRTPFRSAAAEPAVERDVLDAHRALRDAPPGRVFLGSSRHLHLRGPHLSGKTLLNDAFMPWASPAAAGALAQGAFTGGFAPHRAYLDLMGARYVVVDAGLPADPGRRALHADYARAFPVRLRTGHVVVYENPSAHGPVTAWSAAALYVGDPGAGAALALALAARGLPLVHETAGFVTRERAQRFAAVYRGPGGRVEEGVAAGDLERPPVTLPQVRDAALPVQDLVVERPDAHRIDIRLSLERAALVVFTENAFPFWRAEVDGRPERVEAAGLALLGVPVGAGSHHVAFRYEPPRAYGPAATLGVLALAACGVLAVRHGPWT